MLDALHWLADILRPSSVEELAAPLSVSVVATAFFGEISLSMEVLAFAMVVDVITGIMASRKKQQETTSSVFVTGITKKLFMILMIGLGFQFDRLLGVDLLKNLTTYFYLANEGLSVLENVGEYGVGVPPEWMEVIQMIRNTKPEKKKEE